jgi:hypothetical protein
VHHKFIPEGAMVNKKRHKERITCLQQAVCQNHSKMLVAKDWVLLYDNAPAHGLLFMQ